MAYISFQPNDYFNTKLYTGNGSTQSITGVGFRPDMTWGKARSTTTNHVIQTPVQGLSTAIFPNLTNAESTGLTNAITSFDTDGFSLGDWSPLNASSQTFVSWNWKANGSGSANTDGSISSTVSANTTAGFSIVTYTGTGATATVGHGLGVTPKVIIIKGTSNTGSWGTYHSSIGETKKIILNSTAAEVSSGWMNNTAPTSSVFTVINDADVGSSGYTYVAYCFAEKKGFSKFGSYVGNNNTDGIFLYLGFKARFIMIKNISTSTNGDWIIYDTARDTDNPISSALEANQSQAEVTGTGRGLPLDITSTGIKMRHSYGESNASSTYIYMAFAEHPLVSSNDIPATAR